MNLEEVSMQNIYKLRVRVDFNQSHVQSPVMYVVMYIHVCM